MKVLVAGATGFTGRRVVAALRDAGHTVRCFVRPGSDRRPLERLGAEQALGDLADAGSLHAALVGVEAFVCVASLGFGHAPGIVATAAASTVGRVVFFSTAAVLTTLPAPSKRVRLAAEESIRESSLDYVVLRPTMIYGEAGDRNVERLLAAASRFPVLPVVGGGRRLVQPVLVDDVASAAAAAVASARASRRRYVLAGARPLPFREFVAGAQQAVGRAVRIVDIPAPIARALVRVYGAVVARPALRVEQVERLLEDKDFDTADARRDLGFAPMDPVAGLHLEASRLGLRRSR